MNILTQSGRHCSLLRNSILEHLNPGRDQENISFVHEEIAQEQAWYGHVLVKINPKKLAIRFSRGDEF